MNEHNYTLSMFIRNEMIYYYPKTTHADTDIKSVKSDGGVEKLRMIHFPDFEMLDSMNHEEPKELHVIIDRSIFTTKPPINSFERMMTVSELTMVQCVSKWKVSNAINFQENHEAAINKTAYFK